MKMKKQKTKVSEGSFREVAQEKGQYTIFRILHHLTPPSSSSHNLSSKQISNSKTPNHIQIFISPNMKLLKSFNPNRLFSSKSHRSKLSRSQPPSFGSASSSTSSAGTPTSVLPSLDWADFSDPTLSRKELKALLGLIGAEPPSEEEIKIMMGEMDRVGPACHSELRDTFEIFDADHDGRITAEELFSVFTAMGDEGCTLEDCRRMIAGVDKNGDGFVCFDDFARMMDCQR
ncbi:probable calcium-binding protein CML35 [Cucumis melo]|uniref:Probable calcium-binding protein CML35 n=1 Tax=Cucumis melo TaxID=3656 RepID=A0A1S3B7R8_CUCME|nr:probable calcium-binding protein CML35 [Cucumis melo]